MRSPLIVKRGQMEILTDADKLRVPRLNLGPSEPLIAGDTITVFANIHHLISVSGITQVRTILGGDEGDILVLTGERVRLRRGGNIAETQLLQEDRAVTLYFIDSQWVQSR